MYNIVETKYMEEYLHGVSDVSELCSRLDTISSNIEKLDKLLDRHSGTKTYSVFLSDTRKEWIRIEKVCLHKISQLSK